jgi:hypothetical protein
MNALNFVRDYADAHPHAISVIAAAISLFSLTSVLVMDLMDLRQQRLRHNARLFKASVKTTIMSANRTRVL